MRKKSFHARLASLRSVLEKAAGSPVLWAAALLALVMLCEAHGWIARRLSYAYEDYEYWRRPSAELAYQYAEAHFSAAKPGAYDLQRADYFLHIAAGQDKSLPYVYHELARIQFLEGNFPSALAYINVQIARQGDKTPNSYYIRGLIEGFEGDYADSIKDYAHFLQFDPNDWAALNDYAWVLMKDGRYQDAAGVTARGLQRFPSNAWLLNSSATALFQIGSTTPALARAHAAEVAVQALTPASWSHAYPGNDPAIAREGLDAFKAAVAQNEKVIAAAAAGSR